MCIRADTCFFNALALVPVQDKNQQLVHDECYESP